MKYIGKPFLVSISTAPSHPPVSVVICEYRPQNQDTLLASDFDKDSKDDMSAFAKAFTLPYAIPYFSVGQLEDQWLKHIRAISKLHNLTGDSKTLSSKVLRAVCLFQEEDPLARGVCGPNLP